MKLTSPDIQRDTSSAISTEVINEIIRDIGDSLFAIFVDESCDMSSKEQMTIVLRYVDKGHVIESFVGYDGASNMRALVAVAKKHS
ncbi:hypothetical protein L3X38_017023 [Prunus dulcis]|uniref:DUF4371 domain-containing protein n=1 Tax=Prunus dulcis TaxID=3755 RepID=A0AAD4W8A8_PRUDU|nr:hypothetical protein L3X38_017023 [Prunus dulcis]